MISLRDYLDSLNSYYYYEREKIMKHINNAERNHYYTYSKYQIEQEKFQERIEFYTNLWDKLQ